MSSKFLAVELCCALALVSSSRSQAEVVTLAPSGDTYISEHFIGTNGTVADMVIGSQGLFAGGSRNRGLMRFDLSGIPKDATITGVTVSLTVTKTPLSGVPSNFHLHRLLVGWDEAQTTWTSRLSPETGPVTWTTAGGAAGSDYATDSSAHQFIAGTGTFQFTSTPALVADVTAWVTDPTSNDGWLIKTEDESIDKTAGHFAPRENQLQAPALVVQYDAAPVLSITGSELNLGAFCLHFVTQAAGTYFVERRDALEAGAWNLLTNLPPGTAGPVTVCDPLGNANRFYRVGVR